MRAHAQPGWRKLGLAALALLALTLMLAACGMTTSTGTGGSGGTTAPTATTDTSGGSGGYGGYAPRATATPASAATTAPAGNGTVVKVEIGGAGTYSFSPASVTIKDGTTVTWTNNSAAPHTVTSNAGAPAAFDSGTVNSSGGTFSFTFTTPGTYTYHCNFHSYMQGTVVVTM